MKAKSIYMLFLILFSSLSYAGLMIPRNSHGTWTYDSIFDNTGKVVGFQAGLYASNVNNYNASALTGHKITQTFTYGGDIELYCRGNGGSSASTPCTSSNVFVYYTGNGAQSTQTYAAAASPAGSYSVVTILDGVIGSDVLLTFNSLSVADANVIADKVAQTICADNRVAGVQFDLEPFNMTKVGQVNFFTRIAQNFAGQNTPGSPDPFGCVNASHPNGRFFSVFASAGGANATVASVFNKYRNGYFIDSLYDLAPTPAGVVTSPTYFASLIQTEIAKMMSQAKTYNIKYQFGIPASASAHEFENVDGTSTGFQQINYVTAAISAINASGASADPLFRGINLWGFKQGTYVQGHKFLPNIPDTATLNYLGSNL